MVNGKGQTDVFAVIVWPGKVFKIINHSPNQSQRSQLWQLIEPTEYRSVLDHPRLKKSRDFKNRVKKIAELVGKHKYLMAF